MKLYSFIPIRKLFFPMAGLVAIALQTSAYAMLSPIDGSISFDGHAALNGPLDTATEFTSFWGPACSNRPVVLCVSGNFSPVPIGTPADFNPLCFYQTGPLSQPDTLWTFCLNSITYSFAINSITIVDQTPCLLELGGTGTLQLTGMANTPAAWTLTDTSCGMTFSAQTLQPVPEPRDSALFLGSLLIAAIFQGARTFFKNSGRT